MFFSFVIALALVAAVSAHGRWKCPSPRDALDEAGNHSKCSSFILKANVIGSYHHCTPNHHPTLAINSSPHQLITPTQFGSTTRPTSTPPAGPSQASGASAR
ncbi:hypothetical protein B484DRAFT_113733 [Ochromonadaceae sp. CCMP2298]|nr:hypothetical protein B484DRAFT_113733 [Ochromonadaceae sp. CCMP2298]